MKSPEVVFGVKHLVRSSTSHSWGWSFRLNRLCCCRHVQCL